MSMLRGPPPPCAPTSQYGLNIQEAGELRAQVGQLGLGGTVLIYPGADEVGMALLGKLAADWAGHYPVLQLVYRCECTPQLAGMVARMCVLGLHCVPACFLCFCVPTVQCTLHYTTLHYTTLHYTTLHYTTLHYTTLHYTTPRFTPLCTPDLCGTETLPRFSTFPTTRDSPWSKHCWTRFKPAAAYPPIALAPTLCCW
jgi:hypothetical protein